MKPMALLLIAAALTAPLALRAQTTSARDNLSVPQSDAPATPIPALALAKAAKKKPAATGLKPFSRIGESVGVGLMGVNIQAATNINRYMNLRGTGNFVNYAQNNISVNGFTVDAMLNMATGGAGVDFFPFPNHGLRLSGGALFYNQNTVSANVVVSGGTSFKLNGVEYYSSTANPVHGTGSIAFNAQNPAPTFTLGWGNLIPRKGGHWSVPFELGAAMVGTPNLNLALTSGQVCTNPAGTVGCVNVVGNTTLNSNLQAQIATYRNDLDPLRFYPVISVGVGYAFQIRK